MGRAQRRGMGRALSEGKGRAPSEGKGRALSEGKGLAPKGTGPRPNELDYPRQSFQTCPLCGHCHAAPAQMNASKHDLYTEILR
eukprot:6213388-Pleurochrysis_carterae.AAC.1